MSQYRGSGSELQDPFFWPLVFVITFLLIAVLFHMIGMQPLYLEEQRRAVIALEMILNNNYWVPTEVGALYFKKPPLYNWLIILAYKLFGNYNEWTVRFFHVVSFLGLGLSTYYIGKKYINQYVAIYASLFFLVSVDLLFSFSLVAEIDLFYSLLTFWLLVWPILFYDKKQFARLFVGIYFLAALGALTKGFPSIVFVGFTLVGFFTYKKDWKNFFHLYHIVGGFLFLGIVGGYFYIYNHYHSPLGFFDGLWNQSAERTPLQNEWWKIPIGLARFPFRTLVDLLPASLLIGVLWKKSIHSAIIKHPFLSTLLIIVIANIWIYWISPGTRNRYVYMFYPLLLLFIVFAWHKGKEKLISYRNFIYYFWGVIILLLIPVCFVVPLVPQWIGRALDGLWITSFIAGIIMGITAYFYWKRPQLNFLMLILAFIIARFVFNTIVIPLRLEENSGIHKANGLKVAAITKDTPLYMLDYENSVNDSRYYEGLRPSLGTVYYIEKERQETLGWKKEVNTSEFYIAQENQLKDYSYTIYHEFDYQDRHFLLIQFSKPK